MVSEDIMLQKLIALLNEDLPKLDADDIKQLCKLILGENITCGIDLLAKSLLKSKTSVGQALAVLLRCEWLVLQQLIEQNNVSSVKQQVVQFSSCIERFNGLQLALIRVTEQHWKVALNHEITARVLAECKASWFERGYVCFHNYFNDISVVAKVSLMKIDAEHYVHVKLSPELARVFSISENSREAFISSPDRKYNVNIAMFQCRDTELLFSILAVQKAKRELRCEVRVKLDEPLISHLDIAAKKIDFNAVDFSCGGVGLWMEHGEQEVKAGDRVRCCFQLNAKMFEFEDVQVRWVNKDARGLKLGLKLVPDAHQRDAMYKFLFVQQQHIASRIHQLPIPDWVK